jgi:lipid-binding SYLF domain-containing protein
MTRDFKVLRLAALLAAILLAAAPACYAQEKKASAAEERKELQTSARETIGQFNKADPGFDKALKEAAGYVVFPKVGKAGFIVGAAHGDGEVFEKGKSTGTASVTMGTVGLQAGAQEYSQVIVFRDPAALARFKQNKFEFAANASAVAIKTGAAAAAKYDQGVAVFVRNLSGIMAEAAVGAQRFKFTPDGGTAKK